MLIEPRKMICPWCGEANTVMLDTTMANDEFVEDCQVCCAPILYSVYSEIDTGRLLLSCRRENE